MGRSIYEKLDHISMERTSTEWASIRELKMGIRPVAVTIWLISVEAVLIKERIRFSAKLQHTILVDSKLTSTSFAKVDIPNMTVSKTPPQAQ